MGLLVSVYRSEYDSENNQFYKKKQLCVVNVEGPFQPSEETPAAKLVKNGTNHCIVVPDVKEAEGKTPFMFGGTFAATSDSRWSKATGLYAAIPIHDRSETWNEYNLLSR